MFRTVGWEMHSSSDVLLEILEVANLLVVHDTSDIPFSHPPAYKAIYH